MKKIGIIGRPNVGKSTLFNRLAGQRIAIVDDMAGVTRDRIEFTAEWLGRRFRVVDTAGYDLKEEIVKKEMQRQFMYSLEEADFFILMVDGREGVHPLDEIVCGLLREGGKSFVVAVNKIDSSSAENLAYDFFSMGIDKVFPISATHGRNVDDLMDEIISRLPEDEEEESFSYDGRIKLIVTGRPNVGKSSMINRWLGEERLIVTDIPGTTRDAVDTLFEYGDEKYVLIDTAGIRKKSVMFKDRIEKYGYYRWEDALSRADIAVCLIDGAEGLNERDVKVIADAWEAGRPIILVVNKWDAVENKDQAAKEMRADIDFKLQFLSNPPVIFASAMSGKNVYKIFEAAKGLYKEYTKRVGTGEANRVLQTALDRHQPPVVKGRRLKLYFMTQVAACPPQFVIFANYPDSVHFSYQRFVINIIREFFGFEGIPIKLFLRQRGEKKEA
ncbi:ribosome biogenesis GTPase Der [Geovibrio thiophilus]|uniref:GTPase Der n=1 Tax=Geovibrio thiophilus TaxID=139438 RepID=A0A3R5Z157_9BACT|nr:ribosome biogenesis GTPase Der [Geovibrio thiophilus]QAR34430.1 ribosome biogenesis GTPase Der [Geovibrio thiophilus]